MAIRFPRFNLPRFMKKTVTIKPKVVTKQEKTISMAKQYIGTKEIAGSTHNPKVVKMFAAVGHDWVKDDETAWCAAFVGFVLKQCNLPYTGKLNARSYLDIGEPVAIEDAVPGDVVIFSRGNPSGWQGHVAFYVSHTDTHVNVLGGNQSNAVNIKPYSRSRLLGVRRIS